MAHTDACKRQTLSDVNRSMEERNCSIRAACELASTKSDGIPANTIRRWYKEEKARNWIIFDPPPVTTVNAVQNQQKQQNQQVTKSAQPGPGRPLKYPPPVTAQNTLEKQLKRVALEEKEEPTGKPGIYQSVGDVPKDLVPEDKEAKKNHNERKSIIFYLDDCEGAKDETYNLYAAYFQDPEKRGKHPYADCKKLMEAVHGKLYLDALNFKPDPQDDEGKGE